MKQDGRACNNVKVQKLWQVVVYSKFMEQLKEWQEIHFDTYLGSKHQGY